MNTSPRNPLLAAGSGDIALLGGWCTLANSFAAELVASSGVDYAVVDMQHGLSGFSDLVPMLQAIAVAGVAPLVRVPQGGYGVAQRALDAGALGVIFPMIHDRSEAEEAVRCCFYPPLGQRSFGPVRSKMRIGSDPVWANQNVLCLVQIESREAVSNLQEILQAPGVSGVYVGPADLALTHGFLPGDDSAELMALLGQVAAACRSAGSIPAIHTQSGSDALRMASMGYRMCSVGTDSVWLSSAYSREISVARNGTPRPTRSLY